MLVALCGDRGLPFSITLQLETFHHGLGGFSFSSLLSMGKASTRYLSCVTSVECECVCVLFFYIFKRCIDHLKDMVFTHWLTAGSLPVDFILNFGPGSV